LNDSRATSRRAERTQAFDALLGNMQTRIPALRIAFKDDAPEAMPFWHRAAHGIARKLVPDYDHRFTTVLYPVVYLPVGTRDAYDKDPGRWLATMRHEFIHLMDMKRHPVLMTVSYLLPPFGITVRAFWELRAYTQSMVVQKELGLPLDDAYIDRMMSRFTGRSYLFMLWPSSLARRVLEHARERVRRNEVEGPFATAEFWRDFVRPLLGKGYKPSSVY